MAQAPNHKWVGAHRTPTCIAIAASRVQRTEGRAKTGPPRAGTHKGVEVAARTPRHAHNISRRSTAVTIEHGKQGASWVLGQAQLAQVRVLGMGGREAVGGRTCKTAGSHTRTHAHTHTHTRTRAHTRILKTRTQNERKVQPGLPKQRPVSGAVRAGGARAPTLHSTSFPALLRCMRRATRAGWEGDTARDARHSLFHLGARVRDATRRLVAHGEGVGTTTAAPS